MKKIFGLLLVVILIIGMIPMCAIPVAAEDTGEIHYNSYGSGTVDEPFLIKGTDQLKEIISELNNGNDFSGIYFRLETDIDDWVTPIGTEVNPFNGNFDGNHKTVSLNMSLPESKYVGFFGCIGGGSLSNLNITGFVQGLVNVGGVCGCNNGGTISNCLNAAKIIGETYTGGICGINNGTIDSCNNSGKVYGKIMTGGICGCNFVGTVINCVNSGDIYALANSDPYVTDYFIDGICGGTLSPDQIVNCISTGEVHTTPVDPFKELGGEREPGEEETGEEKEPGEEEEPGEKKEPEDEEESKDDKKSGKDDNSGSDSPGGSGDRKAPKTGDSSNMALWIIMLIVPTMGLLTYFVHRRRENA